MSILEMTFGHYQTVSISLRAALQPRAETFPFPPFAGTGRLEPSTGPFFYVSSQEEGPQAAVTDIVDQAHLVQSSCGRRGSARREQNTDQLQLLPDVSEHIRHWLRTFRTIR